LFLEKGDTEKSRRNSERHGDILQKMEGFSFAKIRN